MKKIVFTLLCGSFLLAACKKTAVNTVEDNSALNRSAIDAFIRTTIQKDQKFEWSTAPVNMIWSALNESDHILSVGYKPAGEMNVDERLHLIDINSAAWIHAKNEVLELILASEKELDPSLTMDQLVQWNESYLPVLDVYVRNQATIRLLRASAWVRYAEPMGYEPGTIDNRIVSSSGCGSNVAEPGLTEGIDFTTLLPNTKQSWNYGYHKIPNAWTRSTGAGVKVFIIDTGCEFDQENLGSSFNQGNSSGRTIDRIVTLPRATFLGFPTGPVETADDGCGHGTSMAGACAAPRGLDGAACGVAYNASLVTCRAAEDVFLDDSREVKGASDAFVNAANRADVKIISMSMGRITSSSQMSDAIKYAYGKGKLMFVAAGTSFSWTSSWYGVIFPAYMTQVNAITGVRDNQFNNTCTSCHSGSETDFTIVMEKAINERHPLTLAMSGDAPSTVGGSSVSTATAAGIAALVWSRFPTFTRDQVLNKMIATSANYPVRNSSLGWGNLNADAATN